MIFSDSTSSQAAHRQRRLASDEKVRVDKAVSDAVVREGVVRQAGEAPTRVEVDRFQSLMRSRAQDASLAQTRAQKGEPNQRAHPGTSAGAHGDAIAQNTGDRFRALFPSPVEGRKDAVPDGVDDSLASMRSEAEPAGVSTQGSGNASDRGEVHAPSAKAPDAHDRSAQSTPPSAKATSGKPVEAVVEEPSGVKVAHGQSDDVAETPQQLAARVARGEVHAAPVRSSRKGDTEVGGDGKDSMSSAGPGTQGAIPMSNDSALLAGVKTGGDGPQQAQIAAGVIAPGLSELIEKHVKQLLVSDARGPRSRSREVLLRMQSDILPGTDLWLTRSGDGWQLRADVRSRDAYDTLLANQDELIQRFADRALGELSIDPVFHGEGSAVAGLGSTAISPKR